jgi:hypothetical protein
MIRRLLALSILDIALWSLCVIGGIAPGWALAGHGALTALGYAVWLRGAGASGFAAAILGMLGPAGILATLPFVRRGAPGSVRTDDNVFGPGPIRVGQSGPTLAAARMLDGRVHHAGPETVSSLVTVLRHGDIGARRRALETVVRSFEPALSPLIALALTDGDQTIRALAAAASARVAQNLVVSRATLTDHSTCPDTTTRLATLLADHARADVLLSDSQRGHLREDAIALLPATNAARLALTIEAAWAAGDHEAIDALMDDVLASPDAADRDTLALARWWRAEAAA